MADGPCRVAPRKLPHTAAHDAHMSVVRAMRFDEAPLYALGCEWRLADARATLENQKAFDPPIALPPGPRSKIEPVSAPRLRKTGILQ